MRRISFLPLSASVQDFREQRALPPEIEELPAANRTYSLGTRGESGLLCVPLSDDASPIDSGHSTDKLVAILRSADVEDEKAWFLIPQSDTLGINGLAPPLPLVRLDPGTMLALGAQCWLMIAVSQPQAVLAPPELAQRSCPVCGGELALAPVVQCGCGRWTHLEQPEEPNSPQALNCYLAAAECPDCGRPATLQPQMTPEPPEKLLPTAADDLDWHEPTITQGRTNPW